MATIKVHDSELNQLVCKGTGLDNLINRVKHLEKRTFPKDEAMDFDMELKKRNTELMIVLGPEDEGEADHEGPLAAYMLYARVHGIALLHKICVVDVYQRRGFARSMITRLISSLESQGCQKLKLWVDFVRLPAINLYSALGFKNADRARDYYGPGRHALQMVYDDLNYVW